MSKKIKENETSKNRYLKTPQGRRASLRAARRYKYGADDSFLNELDLKTNCPICGKVFSECYTGKKMGNDKKVVDHDHITGKIRGVICRGCNTMLGYAYDNIDTLLNAVEYIKEHNAKQTRCR